MWFAKTCPICRRKVKQSKFKKIETVAGRKITCCENCAEYFKVVERDGSKG